MKDRLKEYLVVLCVCAAFSAGFKAGVNLSVGFFIWMLIKTGLL